MSPDDEPPALDVVPDDVAIQLAATDIEDAAFRALRQAIGETHVLLVLRPARQEKDVDGDALLAAQQPLAQREVFRPPAVVQIGNVQRQLEVDNPRMLSTE